MSRWRELASWLKAREDNEGGVLKDTFQQKAQEMGVPPADYGRTLVSAQVRKEQLPDGRDVYRSTKHKPLQEVKKQRRQKAKAEGTEQVITLEGEDLTVSIKGPDLTFAGKVKRVTIVFSFMLMLLTTGVYTLGKSVDAWNSLAEMFRLLVG